MLKTIVRLALALAVSAGLAAAAFAADDVTLTGKIMCAKCTLKKADAKACQDVLVVADSQGNQEYYITKNAVAEKFGHVCQSTKSAKVTGAVSEQDGKKWLTPVAMEEVKG